MVGGTWRRRVCGGPHGNAQGVPLQRRWHLPPGCRGGTFCDAVTASATFGSGREPVSAGCYDRIRVCESVGNPLYPNHMIPRPARNDMGGCGAPGAFGDDGISREDTGSSPTNTCRIHRKSYGRTWIDREWTPWTSECGRSCRPPGYFASRIRHDCPGNRIDRDRNTSRFLAARNDKGWMCGTWLDCIRQRIQMPRGAWNATGVTREAISPPAGNRTT